jgi:hypothetical protein
MGKSSFRKTLADGSFIHITLAAIKPDKWRPHGVKYRYAWIQNGICRVLFDNHHGKKDHMHVDGAETYFTFESIQDLETRFEAEIRRLGGSL